MEGDQLPEPDRLPGQLPERAAVRARDREAAGDRGAGQGDLDQDGARRAQPPPLSSRLAGDDGARAGHPVALLLLLRPARAGAGSVRDGDRRPRPRALLPGRRAGRGYSARLRRRRPRLLRPHAQGDRRVRADDQAEQDVAEADPGNRCRLGRGRHPPGAFWPQPARLGRELGPAQAPALPLLRPGRLRGSGLRARRLLRPGARPHRRDAPVAAHRRAVPRADRADGRRALDRGRAQGRAAAARGATDLDGGADPPLQARHARATAFPRARST